MCTYVLKRIGNPVETVVIGLLVFDPVIVVKNRDGAVLLGLASAS